MIFDYSIAALVVAGLLCYLLYALLRPERFQRRKGPALELGFIRQANLVAAGALMTTRAFVGPDTVEIPFSPQVDMRNSDNPGRGPGIRKCCSRGRIVPRPKNTSFSAPQ